MKAKNKSASKGIKRRIFAAGGNALVNPEKSLALLRHVIEMTGKAEPRICFLPTARGDASERIVLFYETLHRLPARPRHQRLFIGSADTKDFTTELLSADAIYVGGGNTLNMLAIWKVQGVDQLLRQAYDQGTVLAGESAGALCWFENGSTDSRPAQVSPMECLGFLAGSFCPHYDAEKDRRPTYHQMIRSGALSDRIAADEHVAPIYENEGFMGAVSAKPDAHAYRVRKVGDNLTEDRSSRVC